MSIDFSWYFQVPAERRLDLHTGTVKYQPLSPPFNHVSPTPTETGSVHQRAPRQRLLDGLAQVLGERAYADLTIADVVAVCAVAEALADGMLAICCSIEVHADVRCSGVMA